jgi:hypothetical protein
VVHGFHGVSFALWVNANVRWMHDGMNSPVTMAAALKAIQKV